MECDHPGLGIETQWVSEMLFKFGPLKSRAPMPIEDVQWKTIVNMVIWMVFPIKVSSEFARAMTNSNQGHWEVAQIGWFAF
jgi:hypothetical protein